MNGCIFNAAPAINAEMARKWLCNRRVASVHPVAYGARASFSPPRRRNWGSFRCGGCLVMCIYVPTSPLPFWCVLRAFFEVARIIYSHKGADNTHTHARRAQRALFVGSFWPGSCTFFVCAEKLRKHLRLKERRRKCFSELLTTFSLETVATLVRSN